MNLKEKLARLERASSARTMPQTSPSEHGLKSLLPGEWLSSGGAPVWRIRTEYSLNHQHGLLTLGEFLQNQAPLLSFVAKDKRLQDTPLRRLLFMDTETSGLSGGVGTFAFLVGLGYFTNQSFVIDQFFMRNFQEEPAVLQRFWELLEGFTQEGGALVTFNGKTYDFPLLMNRAVFLRLLRTQPECIHVDLLHAARRAWKKHLPDCTLLTLEERILGLRRTGDVPGSLIPELYFRFLREGDPRPLFPVFYHNRMDILTLVGLLHVLLNLYAPANTRFEQVPADPLALGSVFEELDEYESGIRFLEATISRGVERTEARALLLKLAGFYKRHEQYERAILLWEKAISLPGFSAEPFEELAKFYEHRLKDLSKAKHYTLRALENVRTLHQLRPSYEIRGLRERLLWRLRRLERKLGNGGQATKMQ